MQNKKTLVLGASSNPSRYSYLAINSLIAHEHSVMAIGNKKGMVGDIVINNENIVAEDVDTITLYLNPSNQKPYYDYILATNPKRIIFNPGTENDELENLAKHAGIETIEACTLVLLASKQY
jgi:predicted CoA-binding protein